VLEFSTSIPRTQLRPGYGDGFLGAPLHGHPHEAKTVSASMGKQDSSLLLVLRWVV
jgi:hypothetical protein